MKTVNDVKMALDFDTMINVVYQHRKEKAQAAKMGRPRKKRNKWHEVFPASKV